MIYKYKRYIENSPDGITLDIKGTTDIQPSYLGELDGWLYAYLPEAVEQDERLQAEIVELTTEQKEALKLQAFANTRKHFARYKIDKDVGDLADLIADCMKLIEFNMMLTARLAGDIWGTNPIDTDTKELYKARNAAFLDAVDSGAVTLRGDFDNMDSVMARMLERVSKINQLVRDNYIGTLKEVGLA